MKPLVKFSGIFLIIALLSLSSCATRKVNKTRENLKIIDRGIVQTTSPGDKVYITIPAKPNERPKATTQTYTGNQGASTDIDFNEEGKVTAIRTDCPEIDKLEQKNLQLDYDYREKNSERAFNEMAIKTGKSTLLWMTAIISLAWVARGWVLGR